MQAVAQLVSEYDAPANWFSPEILQPPASFNIDTFQKRINKAIGTTSTGAPIIKLGWSPAVLRFVIPTDHLGEYLPEQGSWIPKYTCFETEIEGLGIIRIAPPRFVLEQRIEVAQYAQHWNAKRFGAMPSDGIYEFLCYVADHGDGSCCEKARQLYKKGKIKNFACYGLYRTPNQDTIELLQYAKRQIELHEKHLNPHTELSEAAIAEAIQYGRDAKEANDQKLSNDAQEMAANFVAPMAHRINASPKALAHGRYSDMGAAFSKSKRSKGGIILPD